jgi:amino acid transporter
MVIAYLFTGAAVSGSFANYGKVLLEPVWHGTFGTGFVLAMIIGVVVVSWFISFQDVQLSTRAMLIIEFVSMALTLVLVALFIGKTDRWIDPAQFRLEGFTTTGLRLGLVLAVFSFSGFEGAATMGGEAKNPLRSIPRAISGTLLCIGTYFIITAYILVAALRGHSPGLDTAEAPLSDFANMLNVPVLGYIIAIGINISNFACVLACLNGASRILFAMSRNGLLPAALGDAHVKHATPHRALAICGVITVVAPVALVLSGVKVGQIFEYLGTLATYGFLFSYVLVSVASPVYLRKLGEGRTRNVVMSVLAVVMLAIPIVGNLYPPPEGPMRFLPYIFLMLLAAGAAWFFYVKSQRPHMLKLDEDAGSVPDLIEA